MEMQEERQPVVIMNQGQKIFGVIHRPMTDSKSPAVLVCHGLGGHKVGKARLYVDLAVRLVKQGITVLRVDFRGSGDSEGDFAKVTVDDEISDAIVALEFLKLDLQVDPERIGLFGRSFGGAIAVSAAAAFGHIKSLALWAPFFNSYQWQQEWQKAHLKGLNQDEQARLLEIEGMRPGYQFLQQLIALTLEEKLKALQDVPLYHVHGQKDTIVDLTHAEQFKKIREKAVAESIFHLLPESDHHFFHQEEREKAMGETVDWFVKTLELNKK